MFFTETISKTIKLCLSIYREAASGDTVRLYRHNLLGGRCGVLEFDSPRSDQFPTPMAAPLGNPAANAIGRARPSPTRAFRKPSPSCWPKAGSKPPANILMATGCFDSRMGKAPIAMANCHRRMTLSPPQPSKCRAATPGFWKLEYDRELPQKPTGQWPFSAICFPVSVLAIASGTFKHPDCYANAGAAIDQIALAKQVVIITANRSRYRSALRRRKPLQFRVLMTIGDGLALDCKSLTCSILSRRTQ